jgi:hypothetical protein
VFSSRVLSVILTAERSFHFQPRRNIPCNALADCARLRSHSGPSDSELPHPANQPEPEQTHSRGLRIIPAVGISLAYVNLPFILIRIL